MICELLRKEIEKTTKSRYRIAQETGVAEAQLCRFMQGQTLGCTTADKLLKYFGYTLSKKRKGKK